MTYWMYIDDERNPKHDEYIVVRSFDEAVRHIQNHGYPSFISFDHDLGLFSKTGFDFAKWLVEQDLDKPWMDENFSFNVHSANPVGAANIQGLLDNYLESKGFR